MFRILLLLGALLCMTGQQVQAQSCTPVLCLDSPNVLEFGGVCDIEIPDAIVNQAYNTTVSFFVKGTCFDAGQFDPSLAGTQVRINRLNNIQFIGFPGGISAGTNATTYNVAANATVSGCAWFAGSPTQAGVFASTINIDGRVALCALPLITITQTIPYSLQVTVKPDAGFAGLVSEYFVTDAPATLTATGTTGGAFSGPGVVGNTFDPALAGPGIHTIKYIVSAQQGTAIAPTTDSSEFVVEVFGIACTDYFDTLYATTCDPLEVGMDTETFPKQDGCDSIITTITTLLPSSNVIIEQYTCNPALVGSVVLNLNKTNGCDSTVTINTILSSNCGSPYITVWKTDNPGITSGNQIEIPGTGSNYIIDWEEVGNPSNRGVVTGNNHTGITFPTPGIYRVKIYSGDGTFSRINFNGIGDRLKLLNIEQWGDIEWSSFQTAFRECSNLTISATDVPNLSNVSSMSSAFFRCFSITDIPNINNWDVSNVSDMSFMFNDANFFNAPLNNWNVSNVTNMSFMFFRAFSFNQPLGNWDVSNVDNMQSILEAAVSFNQNLGSWLFKPGVNLLFAFNEIGWNCDSYGNTINGWAANPNMPNLLDVYAFPIPRGLESLAAVNILEAKNWSFNDGGFDAYCALLDSDFIAGTFNTIWKTDNPGTPSNQIRIPGTGSNYLIYWNEVSNTTNFGYALGNNTTDITFPSPGIYRVRIAAGSGGTFHRINFSDASSSDHLKIINIEQWGNTKWSSFERAYQNCTNLEITATDIPDLSNVSSTVAAFALCQIIDIPNINNWDVSNVTDMTQMFFFSTFNSPLNNWNTANVSSMLGMFNQAFSFNQNIGSWILNPSVSMEGMLDDSGMDCDNYSATLIGWQANNPTVTNRTLGASPLRYGNNAISARNTLVNTRGWIIAGDSPSGQSCPFVCETSFDTVYTTSCNPADVGVTTDSLLTGDGCDSLVTTITTPNTGCFITLWDLSIGGNVDEISFGVATTDTVNYAWQEVSPGSASGSGFFVFTSATISGLPSGSIIRLSIDPTNFTRINISSGTHRNRLVDVEQWGSVQWSSMATAFGGCENLQISATDAPNLSAVTNMTGAFANATNFNSDISNWNTSSVTNMAIMFQNAQAFNQDIGNWNTASVTNMTSMFQNAQAFNQDISNWNTASAVNMASMFLEASSFNQNIGNWTLRSNVNMSNMLNNSGMDCDNYSATLIGWAANNPTVTDRTLGAVGRQYGINAVAARTALTTAQGWSITGDELVASTTWYQDLDGDQYINFDVSIEACTQPEGYLSLDQALGYDCDDEDPTVFHVRRFVIDADGDGYGAFWEPDGDYSNTILLCANTPPPGYVFATVPVVVDCDDNDPDVNPGAEEIPCNGIDDNCDGAIDENGESITYYRDADGDGYGNPFDFTVLCVGDDVPTGYVLDNTDCDDSNPLVNPGMEEVPCNGWDDNCNGEFDENGPQPSIYYEDRDGDGYARQDSYVYSCDGPPPGYIYVEIPIFDCDDDDPTVFRIETLFVDFDGDGAYNADEPVVFLCIGNEIPAGYVFLTELPDPFLLDCDDNDPTVYPGAPELCDGKDNDCNELIDDGIDCDPVDCMVSDWSDWSDCSEECGGGTQTRTRTVITPAANGGAECPVLEETRPCNTDPCTVICPPGEYYNADAEQCELCPQGTYCPESGTTTPIPCPAGTFNANTGAISCTDCPTGTTSEPGATSCTDCPVYYQDADGDGYGNPNVSLASCDGPPQGYVNNNTDCDDTDNTRYPGAPCNDGSLCTLNDQLDDDCNCVGIPKICDDGIPCTLDLCDPNTGSCIFPPIICDDLDPCTDDFCDPITGACIHIPVPNTWYVGEFGECSVTCGGGEQIRVVECRDCFGNTLNDSQCDGTKPSTTQECNTQGCPVDCEVSEWSEWSECTATCGGGTQFRTRTVLVEPANGGAACPVLEEQRACNEDPCCDNDWEIGDWAQCSVECGGGIQQRSVVCKDCEGNTLPDGSCEGPKPATVQECNTQGCPVDCVVSDWSDWSECTATCGGGTQFRTRTVLVEPANGGAACPVLEEQRACNEEPCCDNDWEIGDWAQCSVECGGGIQQRSVVCKDCEGNTLPDGSCEGPKPATVQECNTQGCPVDCVVSDWSDWSECTATCGGGTQFRTRTVLVEPANGGAACPVLEEQRACNEEPCCDNDWEIGDWAQCSVECGGGIQQRSVVCKDCEGNTLPDGSCEGPKPATVQECNTQGCPVDCVVSDWSDWSECTATCGGGTQFRTRTVLVEPANGGAACPVLVEQRTCNTQPCDECTTVPAKPGRIYGKKPRICLGNTSDYYIDPVPGANSYLWSATNGAAIISGQGTTNVTVRFPTGLITYIELRVRAVNDCGPSQVKNYGGIWSWNLCGTNLEVGTPLLPGEKQDTPVEPEIRIFPNPTRGQVTIQAGDLPGNEQLRLRILDIQGRELRKGNQFISPHGSLQIDVRDLPEGIYLIEATSSQYRKVFKLVKE